MLVAAGVLTVERAVQRELELIGSIYDAVLDPGRWSDSVDGIRLYTGLHLGALAISYLPSGTSVQASTNIPPDYFRLMVETADSIPELWGGFGTFARMPLEEPVRMLDYSLPESWPGNPFYEKFCRPQGLVDQLVLFLEYSPSMMATFALGLHESMPPIDEDQVETFRVLAPHMRRAALISGLLQDRAEVALSFEATLSALGSAVLLIDENLRIVYANELAEAMLRAKDPIAQFNGRLDIPRELVKGHFDSSIAAAASGEEELKQAAGIPVRGRDGSGMIVHVLPLKRRAGRPAQRAVAAVFVAQPHTTLNLPLEAMRLLYDLRPAEVRVLELVASGHSGPAVADALGISRNTAKTHTARLFDKLGVHTRAELVRFAREMSLGR